MTATLQSGLFAGDATLQRAADIDSGHIVPGAIGDHVAKIQTALLFLTTSSIENTEFLEGRYGTTTADAVLDYKEEREIINPTYQKTADNIVGRMTMARLDKDLTESQLATLMFDLGERARIEGLLPFLRPGVLRMVNTTLNSLVECKEAFELSIINPMESLRLHRKNALTIDGLKRFFSVDGNNQSRFLPRIITNYQGYRTVFPRLPGNQRGINYVDFLKRFRRNLVRPEKKFLLGGAFVENLPIAISSQSNGAMFFTPLYRLFNPIEPIQIRGRAVESLTGIQVHEMGHFYFNFVDGDPRGKGPEVGLRTTGSYDIVARQATFNQRVVV
jgi:hypothetical protein